MNSSTVPPNVTSSVVFSQWTYWCSLGIAALSMHYVAPGSTQTAILLIPVLAALLNLCVAYWVYEACDEFIRIQLLKCAAMTAIVIAAATLGYFLLELFGSPHVSMLWVNLAGWSAFNLQLIFVVRRSR